MRKRFHIRISDNVLNGVDWPIAAIHIRHNYAIITIMNLIKFGAYGFPNMINWGLLELFQWLKYNSTGQHPEEYHDIGLYLPSENRFYKCDHTFNIETIDSRWMVCKTCSKTTIHNNEDECITCNNRLRQ